LFALTLAMVAVLGASTLLAQDSKEKTEAPKTETPKPGDAKSDTPKPAEVQAEPAKDAAKAPEPAKPAEPTIPPEVQAKLDVARKAVAEAIAAAEKAGLVKTTIDPPPILDILVTGRANDSEVLKTKTDQQPEVGVSPEVFGAWFTGQGRMDGITAEKNVRIVPPSKGLSEWYRQRSAIFGPLLTEARKAAGPAAPVDATKEATKADEPKPAETPKEETKKEG
jgi:hypothetical protein